MGVPPYHGLTRLVFDSFDERDRAAGILRALGVTCVETPNSWSDAGMQVAVGQPWRQALDPWFEFSPTEVKAFGREEVRGVRRSDRR